MSDLRPVTTIADETPAPPPPGTSTMERLSTAFVIFESCRQIARLAAAPREGTRVAPAFALLPVVRGLAAARLLLGRPRHVERALLNALIAGVGAAVPACPALGETPGNERQ